ncbi:hypothetical protein ACF07Q_24875 [Nocardiopsis dassonvillei]|uniref:hypothetical protein n=1 Tax=Nocardiopsis dassonvillei TaxID=2014 RepID=UPI0036F71A2E
MSRTDDVRHGASSEEAVSASSSTSEDAPQPQGEPRLTGDDEPLSQEDALHALRREASSREHAESARMSALTDRLLERLQGEAGGLRIGTLALFNDTVRFGGGFHTSGVPGAARSPDPAEESVDLPVDRVSAHVDNFVRPPDFDRLLQILLTNRVLVLARPDGSGREAVAVNLLAEAVALLAVGRGRILQLGTGEQPGSASWSPREKGCGLLLRTDTGPSPSGGSGMAVSIDLEWIHQVRDALQAADSYMVVVTNPPQGALLNTAAHSEAVVAEEVRADPEAIVHRWVLGEAPAPEQARRLTERLRDSGALDLLVRAPQPRTAVSLAVAVRDGQDLEALVRRLGDPSTRVHQWFDGHRAPEDVSFALAAAVLHDAPYLTVSDAAVDLYHLFTEERSAPPALRFHETLHTTHPWILLTDPDDRRSGQPRVRFREPRTQQAVLAYAWNHLDGQRTSLVRWLRQLATHRDVEVQARACVATAVVAAQDLEHALHRFLNSWAGNSSPHTRRAAATVLGVVSEDPDLTDRVWDLLYTWADLPGNAVERRMAATSALVAGGPPGRRDPDAAVGVLLTALGDRESWDSLGHVAEALAALAGHDRVGHVLKAMLDWSQSQDASPLVVKSLLAFCYVAGSATRPEATDRPLASRKGGRSVACPLLLELSDQHLAAMVELWKRALARKPVQEVALDVLKGWIGHASGNPRARQAVRGVLEGVAAQGRRHRERIVYWLGQWAAGGDEGSAVAAELRRTI